MMRVCILAVVSLVVVGCASSAPETPSTGVIAGPMPVQPVAPVLQPMPPTGPGPVAPPSPTPGMTSTPTTPPTIPGMPPGPVMQPTAGAPAPVPMAGGAAMPPPPPPGGKIPVIPEVTETCPDFRDGTITFMGLGGIAMGAGAKAAGPTAPMVFYWHGTGSFSGEYVGMAGAVATGVASEGGVLISFQGTTGGDLLSGTAIFGAGDLDLADQLTACAVENHNIDPRRIFATGCSAGGLFSTAMAAMRSNYMAAAAPNSGGLTGGFVTFQTPDYTPALMTIHGAAGRDVVIIDFATSSASADRTFKGRGGFVINCDHGGGHCGGGGLAPSIWEFFKAHPYGVDPYPWTSLPAGFHDSCTIYQ